MLNYFINSYNELLSFLVKTVLSCPILTSLFLLLSIYGAILVSNIHKIKQIMSKYS